ncbi:DUF4238 domain-containing protein [Ornithinimicrobium ciconiae]|uniref:DUF4238 domain-containing protein n=1 Tax=Ornithinimicrobium ciconiae TaxID=2594265 RepID=A0A516GAN8_9MICO|nr:DUF4238 domain-containing protein [Ornithinimicrobium ciconiae]QDO88562.1 DUF4238 domain-containing protein [Ornithinimicrobium ciconiae]
MSRRRERHHTVPRLHLRGFAGPYRGDSLRRSGQDPLLLVQYDVNTGSRTDVSIADAAVARNFYTIVLPDGTRSDAWERSLSNVENDIAPALRRAIESPRFRLNDDDRQLLASWIALQYLRGPDNRQLQAAIASFTVRAQVGMGGLAYLKHVMSKHLGRPVPPGRAERVWDDIMKEEGPTIKVRGEDHMKLLLQTFPQAAEQILGRTWGRMRFRQCALAVSDVPVGLVRDSVELWAGGGLGGARAITVPLDRHTLLWLALAGPGGPEEDMDLQATKAFAAAHNESAIGAAERFVYFHPDDDPIAEGTVVPRPPRERLNVSSGFKLDGNRDRALNDVLQQIADRNGRNDGSLIADYTWPIDGYEPPANWDA